MPALSDGHFDGCPFFLVLQSGEEHCAERHMGIWGERDKGQAYTRGAKGGEKDTSQPFQEELILSSCLILESGEDRDSGWRGLSLSSNCSAVLFLFSNPSLDFVGTFEYGFDFRGAQVSCWPRWLENGFLPRRSVIREGASTFFSIF